MRWRKHLLLLLALIWLLAGCAPAEPQPPEPPPAEEASPPAEPAYQPGEHEFWLSAVPELPPFQQFSEISRRYYANYTDHLIPGDYGQLYPFIGKIIGQGDYIATPYYGLCDDQGRVVVDAVYSDFYCEEGGQSDLYCLYGKPVIDDQYDEEYAYFYGYNKPLTIAPEDGSWAVPDISGHVYAVDEQAIIIKGHAIDHVMDAEVGFANNYVTNYVYNWDGTLRCTLANCTISDYADGKLVLGEPSGDSAVTLYRLADLDGNTLLADGYYGLTAPRNGLMAACDSTKIWRLIDEQGQPVDEQLYGQLFYDSYTRYYDFQTADGKMVGALDEDGQLLWEMEQTVGWFTLDRDQFNDQLILRVYRTDNKVNYIRNLDTGEQSPEWQEDEYRPRVLGNGWYAALPEYDDPDGEALLLRWGEPEPLYRFQRANWLWLADDEGRMALINYSSEDEEGNYQDKEVLFDLEQGREVMVVDDAYYDYYVPGLGWAFTKNESYGWRMSIYDEQGQKVLDDDFRYIDPLSDGYYSVYNDIYAGIIDKEGQWLIRFCINSND